MFLILILSLLFNTSSVDKKVQDYLNKHLRNYAKYEYEILSSPDTNLKIEFQNSSAFNINKNMVYIPVKIAKANGTASSFISVKVRLFKNVLTAMQPIKSKTDLDKSMFEIKLVDVTMIRGTVVENFDQINSMRSKSIINIGEVLTREEVESIPVIYSGDEVTAFKTFGGVTISIQAFAREDGCSDDVIKIKTVDSKSFTAKVLSKNKVLIEE